MNTSWLVNNLILWTISLYLILGYGFMQVRIPPIEGKGVPVGEIVLIISLATINYRVFLPKLLSVINIIPFIFWWLLGIGRAIEGFSNYGMWAFRDASSVIESFFLLVGFAFAAKFKWLKKFHNWLPNLLILSVFYALSFPFKGILIKISPVLISGAGASVPLLFNYSCIPILLILGSSYILVNKSDIGNIYFFPLVFLLIISLALFQARTIYIQIIVVFLFLSYFKKELFRKSIVLGLVLTLSLLLIDIFGLNIRGRFEQSTSLGFIYDHFLTIFGANIEGLEGATNGVDQRLAWWFSIYERLTLNILNFLFGLGYGFPLIDFVSNFSIPVREPHNSYISVLARLGFVGFCLFAWMHLLLIQCWRRAYHYCQFLNRKKEAYLLLTLMVFFILCWVLCIGEDGFEKPYITIPYYFFWGIVLRLYFNLKNDIDCPI